MRTLLMIGYTILIWFFIIASGFMLLIGMAVDPYMQHSISEFIICTAIVTSPHILVWIIGIIAIYFCFTEKKGE